MTYVVVGAGAIGGTVGARLIRDGHEVLLCDADAEHVRAINQRGLEIEGPVEQLRVDARAVPPDELPDGLGAVLLAVKAHHTPAAAELLAARLAPDGYAVSLQNGITPPLLAGMLGSGRVVGGVVNFGADRIGPGRIMLGGRGAIRLGELDGRGSERVGRLVADIDGAEATANVLGCLWAKEAYGAMLVATAVSGLPIADVLAAARYRPLLLALAREVLAAADADPEPVDGFDPADLEASVDRMVDFNRRSAKTHTGVYRDLAVLSRPTEVPAILGDLPGPLLGCLCELVRAIEDGRRVCEVANLELLAAQERAERLGRPLNAVIAMVAAPDRAPAGTLHGHAVAVKDNIDMHGLVTTNASLAGVEPAAAADAEVVARLRAASAELFCKTNLLEHSAGSVAPAFGMTRNPRDPDRTSGGSSGGSAALVGAGVCELAIGTDCGGSVRIPAAYCGVVGLKPTAGLVPVAGVHPLAPTCDHVGILARTVAQAAELLGVAAGIPVAPVPVKGARVGVLERQLDDRDLAPGVRAAVAAAIGRMPALGFEVVPVDLPELAEADDALGTIVCYEAFRVHRATLVGESSLYGPGTLALLEYGAGISDAQYRDALEARDRIARAFDRALDGADVLAGPTAPFVAPPEDPPFGTPEGAVEARFTGPPNLAGTPAVTIPCGNSDGLPVGLQLIGRRHADVQLLAVAAAVHAAVTGSA